MSNIEIRKTHTDPGVRAISQTLAKPDEYKSTDTMCDSKKSDQIQSLLFSGMFERSIISFST